MNKSRVFAALAVAAVLVGAQAPTAVRAATVDFDVTLKALVGTTGGTGSLALTIAPGSTSGTVFGSNVTGDINIGRVNISLNGDPVSYLLQGSSFLLAGVFSGQVPVAGGVESLFSLTLGTNGFYIFTDTANASLTSSGSVSVSQTPLPTSLPLLATGFGMIAMLGWYRKRKTGSYFAA
jgi:hypothetical protein